jgi:hypothetical protein
VDGLGTISYQWRADAVNISGATGSTFTLTQAEVGKAIAVVASYTDLGGTAESLSSAATGLVVNVNDLPVATAASATTNEDTAKTGTLAGTDLDGNTLTFAKVADPSHGTVTVNATTGAYTYTPTANYSGTDSFTFKVNDGTVDSAAATVSITVSAVNDVPVAIAASATTNEDTAKTGTLAGTDLDGNTLTFAKVADPINGTVTVNASTGAYTYTPTANYSGTDSFTFKVNDGTVDSAVATVSLTIDPVNDAPTGSVTISGTVTQGQVLTAANTLADVDGLGTISYQWRADAVNISGATGSTFTLTQAEVGKAITVVASYTDVGNTLESMASAATGAVVNVNDVPTGSVTISETVTQGQVLTVANTLADVDGLGNISYQWKADGVNISGATGSTFTLTQAEVGKAITAVASYTDLGGAAESVASNATSATLPLGVNLSGQIYHWKTHTLLKDVSVGIDSLSITSKSNAAGAYTLNSIEAQSIKLAASLPQTTLETGSRVINSLDALAALKISVGLNPNLDGSPVSPYQLIAADVNRDGRVNSLDALAILKMAVGRSDAPAREWLFVSESQDFWDETANNGQGGYTVSRTNVTWNKDLQTSVSQDTTVNLLAVLKGDVNGTWTGPNTDVQILPNSYFVDLVKKGFGPLSTWAVITA